VRNQKPFNPDVIPPDFDKAAVHASASGIGAELHEVSNAQFCDCCARQVERETLNICFDNESLAHFGAGYPLYFEFLK
jgi:hypothetical protein